MHRTATTSDPPRTDLREASWIERVFRRILDSKLRTLESGVITLVDGDRMRIYGDAGSSGPSATLFVHDPAFYPAVVLGGSIGAGESFAAGSWSASDLTDLVRILAVNPQLDDQVESGLARLREPLRKAFHRLHANTRRGSLRNIAAHYDLGNEFFALFLDPTMTYSCGFFEHPDATLEEASVAKYDRICRKIGAAPALRILEIGCGWGGFAIHAASRYGCRVTGTTISRNQHALAVKRVREAGLEDLVKIVRIDYRDLPRKLEGRFDRVVSIEMIEAVGHANLGRYFEVCSRMLEPDGLMALQAITMADRRYDRYRRSVDFIQRYIFPGGLLPSLTAMAEAVRSDTDLGILDVEDIGPHYATTLRLWKERFLRNLRGARRQGYTDEFLRLWEFYLGYCEGAFLERAVSDVQMILARPAFRCPAAGSGGIR